MAVPSGRMYWMMFDQLTEMAMSVSFTISRSLPVSPKRCCGFCCRNHLLVSTPWSMSEMVELSIPHNPSQSTSRRSSEAVGWLTATSSFTSMRHPASIIDKTMAMA